MPLDRVCVCFVFNTLVLIFSYDFLSFAISELSKIKSQKIPLKWEFIIYKKIKTALHCFYIYIKHLSIELPWESTCRRPSPMLEDF